MTKKLFVVVAFRRKATETGNIDEVIDRLSAQVFTEKAAAVNRICASMEQDLLDFGVPASVVSNLETQHSKGNYISPSRFWAIVFPFGGGDRGAIELVSGEGIYYKIQESYVNVGEAGE